MVDERAVLDELQQLWRREQQTTEARFAEQRRGLELQDRCERGLALRKLHVAETGPAAGDRVRLWLASEQPVDVNGLQLGSGDPVVLWRTDPEEPGAVQAVVSHMDGDRVVVLAPAEQLEGLEAPGLRLDREAPRTTFERGERALRTFRTAETDGDVGRLRAVFFGGRAPRFADVGELQPFDPGLNDRQRRAVQRASAARDVALIHGPPGTGKTRTLTEVVRQAARRAERVLVAAASNTAVDNLAERLAAAELDVVRLGHPARVSPAMERRTLDALVQSDERWTLAQRWFAEAREIWRKRDRRSARGSLDRRDSRRMGAEARQLVRDARKQVASVQQAVLSRCHVVCATAAGSDSAILGDAKFDWVVLDEATQAPDPIALVALARGQRAVLAGDPQQLPPTVLDLEAARQGLGTTLFERLAARHGDAVEMLEVQYRMHADIMRFPSQSKYDGRLRAAEQVEAHRLEELAGVQPDPLRPSPLLFVDTSGKGWDEEQGADDPSTRNPLQAERVAAEVRRLLGRGLDPSQLAVITPYQAQVRLLRHELAAERGRGLEVGTVDGFQGREKEAVLVDLVRSNERGELGFLTDTRRMNVALTRARRLLLVVGDSATLGGHDYYRAFLDGVEQHGAYLSAWGDDAPPFE
jgi:superfamily I DNA and/or RNA helicase